MSGLRRVCKFFGGITATANGVTVKHVWDYAADEPTTEAEMPIGSDRWKASERAKWEPVVGSPTLPAQHQEEK